MQEDWVRLQGFGRLLSVLKFFLECLHLTREGLGEFKLSLLLVHLFPGIIKLFFQIRLPGFLLCKKFLDRIDFLSPRSSNLISLWITRSQGQLLFQRLAAFSLGVYLVLQFGNRVLGFEPVLPPA